MGYGKIDEDYKPLLEEIEKIEAVLKSEESTKNIFEDLKTKLSSFMASFNKAYKPQAMPHEEKKEQSSQS